MNLSKTKIIAFFIAILILGWMLYPKSLFLGFIYEGMAEIQKAEAAYRRFLAKKPTHKFASLRLAKLYERMAEPEKALELLEKLYRTRSRDKEVIDSYLNLLEELHDEYKLYQRRLELVKNSQGNGYLRAGRREDLLYGALEYALWNQQFDEAYTIVSQLVSLGRNPQFYRWQRFYLDLASKNTDKVLTELESQLSDKPEDEVKRKELIEIYVALGRKKEALKIINEGLVLNPKSKRLLEERLTLYEKTKDYPKAIRDAALLLSLESSQDQKTKLQKRLAFLYRRNNQLSKALRLYQGLIKAHKKDRESWLAAVDILASLKDIKKAAVFLEEYLQLFPNDKKQEKILAEYYLYSLQDLARLDFYRKFIKKHKNEDFGLEVAYLIAKNKGSVEALSWLKEMEALFPQSPKILLELAQIYALLADRKNAIGYYLEGARRSSQDLKTLIFIGRELLFLGETKKSLEVLKRAQGLDSQEAETWFWLFQANDSLGLGGPSREASEKVVILLEPKLAQAKKSEQGELWRMYLKSKARSRPSQDMAKQYREALEKNPSDFELHRDFSDYLMEKRKLSQAKKELEIIKRKFPQEADKLKPHEARLALEENKGQQAIVLFKQLIKENPGIFSYTMGLAQAYAQDGQWRKARQQLEGLYKEAGDIWGIRDTLRQMAEECDHRLAAVSRSADFGQERVFEQGFRYQGYRTERLKSQAQVFWATFEAPDLNFKDKALYGELSLISQPTSLWSFGGGLSFGSSPRKKTFSPSLSLGYRLGAQGKLTFSSYYNSLRLDLPQAVSAGGVDDGARFEWRYRIHDDFFLSGLSGVNRTRLRNQAWALTESFNPSLGFALWEKPYVSFGYQYNYQSLQERRDFLNQVSLIKKTNAHYLTTHLDWRLQEDLNGQMSLFMGEDTSRKLRFLKGELWGLSLSFKWNIERQIDFDFSYDFGKETFPARTGKNHNVMMTLSGHWR